MPEGGKILAFNVVDIQTYRDPVVLNSREMAELTGKQHGNLMTKLRKLEQTGEVAIKESTYIGGRWNNTYPEYKFTKAQALAVANRLPESDREIIRKHLGVSRAAVVTELQAECAAVGRLSSGLECSLAANNPGVLTMSSLTIAELTGKDHKNVIRDIRNILDELSFEDDSVLSHIQEVKDSRGYTAEFLLPRREVDILLTGYSVPLRAKVIDRWRELEEQVAKPAEPSFKMPVSFAEALRLAADLEEQKLALIAKVEEDAPKVKVYHEIADASGLIGYQKLCTQLNLKQREVKHWLKDIGWLRAHQYAVNPLPTASAVHSGYCKIKSHTLESGRHVQYIQFTPKGLTYVSEKAPSYVRK
jgi:phage regulator Rha-like protein